ncbi:vacuolar proton ATPase 100-kDa subunit [Pelomyxa schiedti]|nr:vacuolar proton ATPase 100-kDa subunit [Pelomyxa schiedti]
MGSIWRSQPMQKVQLFIQKDSAHDTLDELGELGSLQFKDLNQAINSFQRTFVTEVKHCEELERKLRFLAEQIARETVELQSEKPPLKLESFCTAPPPEKPLDLSELEAFLDTQERDLRQINGNQEVLLRNFNELTEMRCALKSNMYDETLPDMEISSDDINKKNLLEEGGAGSVGKLVMVAGVISKTEFVHFERVLWRVLRGNLVMKVEPIEEKIVDPSTGEPVEKCVFFIFCQGQQSQVKIHKICESFSARVFNVPETNTERQTLLTQVSGRLEDMKTVIERSSQHRRELLATVNQSMPTWVILVRKEKATYHTLNMFNYDVGRKCLIAEGWCPTSATDEILNALNRATARSGSQVATIMSIIPIDEEPPTFYQTNKFTYCMQVIIDAYGTPRYGEVNPTVFSLITFPFLFAVMFGDTGHAVMMLLFTLCLIFFEKKMGKMKLNEIVFMLFNGRYLLLFMALFSIFTGFIYNDVFGIGVNLCGTAWTCDENNWCTKDPDRVYEFGVDSIWKGADNELYYYNSFKMKLSVIFGVVQMTLGIIMGLFNHIHFRKPLNIIFDFIPQILFMNLLFGYLVVLIFLKWTKMRENEPYLINVLIDIFLSFGNLPKEEEMYPGQASVQTAIAIVSVIAIFVMLLPKPFIQLWQSKRAAKHVILKEASEDVELEAIGAVTTPESHGGGGHGGHGEEFVFSEAFIHQAIHTIEFVLGCISNTASYLRLWALSLAHAELSLVFYEQVLLTTIKSKNFIEIFAGFAVWGGATIGVLLVMEALSAFLHALRLHWVEFQNKFYQGDGYAFEPLDFKKLSPYMIED